MTSQASSLGDLVGLLVKEGKQRTVLLASILVVVALAALAIGIALPKRYDASTLLVRDAIIEPLARTGTPKEIDYLGAITLELTEGRKILRELLAYGGWVPPPPARQPDPVEEALLLGKLRSHIKVDPAKDGMLRISYSDSNPDRAYKIANKIAEIYIRESNEAHKRDSREALEFIDDQVKDYAARLAKFHEEVLVRYRHQDATAPGPAPSASPATSPASSVARPIGGISAAEVSDLREQKAALEEQLGRKPASSNALSPTEEQLRSRIAQTQIDLDRLLAVYTEGHPEVQRLKRELAADKEEFETLEVARKNDAQNTASLDEDLRQAARIQLDELNKKLAAAGAPLQAGPRPAGTTGRAVDAENKEKELHGIGEDTTLSELLHRYEATRDTYQDLLKRREGARVFLDLATGERGASLRVQEPAERPATATGLRLTHFCIGGLVLGTGIPLGVLLLIVRLDQRVRSVQQIEGLARVPVLARVSAASDAEGRWRSQDIVAMLMVAGVLVAYLAAFVVRQRMTS